MKVCKLCDDLCRHPELALCQLAQGGAASEGERHE
jgi:hypothetical protein